MYLRYIINVMMQRGWKEKDVKKTDHENNKKRRRKGPRIAKLISARNRF